MTAKTASLVVLMLMAGCATAPPPPPPVQAVPAPAPRIEDPVVLRSGLEGTLLMTAFVAVDRYASYRYANGDLETAEALVRAGRGYWLKDEARFQILTVRPDELGDHCNVRLSGGELDGRQVWVFMPRGFRSLMIRWDLPRQ